MGRHKHSAVGKILRRGRAGLDHHRRPADRGLRRTPPSKAHVGRCAGHHPVQHDHPREQYAKQQPTSLSPSDARRLLATVLFGVRPEELAAITDEVIKEACVKAAAWKFIQELPNKLETVSAAA